MCLCLWCDAFYNIPIWRCLVQRSEWNEQNAVPNTLTTDANLKISQNGYPQTETDSYKVSRNSKLKLARWKSMEAAIPMPGHAVVGGADRRQRCQRFILEFRKYTNSNMDGNIWCEWPKLMRFRCSRSHLICRKCENCSNRLTKQFEYLHGHQLNAYALGVWSVIARRQQLPATNSKWLIGRLDTTESSLSIYYLSTAMESNPVSTKGQTWTTLNRFFDSMNVSIRKYYSFPADHQCSIETKMLKIK